MQFCWVLIWRADISTVAGVLGSWVLWDYAFWRFSEVLAKYEKHLLHGKHLTHRRRINRISIVYPQVFTPNIIYSA